MADVNVKLGVSGVSQFKNEMKKAESSVKTLDAALKLNEKQYKASGDAETYMEQKSKLLQQQIEEQRYVVQQAEAALQQMAANGVDQLGTAYQGMQQKMLTAQNTLLGMQMDLAGMDDSASAAVGGIDGLSDSLSNIDRNISFDKVKSGLEGITGTIEAVATRAVQLGRKLWDVLGDNAAWADDLMTRSAEFGIDPDTLQRMEKTANLIDTPVDAILKARQKLAQNMVNGGDSIQELFGKLGIQVQETGGQFRDSADVMWEIGRAMELMTSDTERDAVAQKLMGRSWKELMPLFLAGKDAYEEMNASWNVVDQDTLDNLGGMDDSLQKMNTEWETMQHNLIGGIAPAFQTISDALTGIMTQFNEYLQTEDGKKMMDSLNEALTTLFASVTDLNYQDLMQGFVDGLNGLTTAFQWIADNGKTITDIITGLGIAFGALKLAEGGLKVLELVNGLKGLIGGSTAAADAAAAVGGSAATGFVSAIETAAPWLATIGTAIVAGVPLADLLTNPSSVLKPTESLAEVVENNPVNVENLKDTEKVKSGIELLFGILNGSAEAAAEAASSPASEPVYTGTGRIRKPNHGNGEFGGTMLVEPEVDTEEAQKQLSHEVFSAPVTLYPVFDSSFDQVPGWSGGIGTKPKAVYNEGGMDYVPYNGFASILHKGEAVLPANQAAAYRNGGVGDMRKLMEMFVNGMSQMTVSMDGSVVGGLVAPSVSEMIARQIGGV